MFEYLRKLFCNNNKNNSESGSKTNNVEHHSSTKIRTEDFVERGEREIDFDFDFESNSNTFYCNILHHSHLYTPQKIICYNCSDDFKITSITLIIGGLKIIDIPNIDVLNNVVDFVENISLPNDNKSYKTYHLDKTSLFFQIKLMYLKNYDCAIKIVTTGTCDKIKLRRESVILSQQRKLMYDNKKEHTEIIKHLMMGSVQKYNSWQPLHLYMGGLVNGIILTNINPDKISKISLKINGWEKLDCNDKYEILTNTQRINNTTLYVGLNHLNYMDDVGEYSVDTTNLYKVVLKLELDEGYENIDYHILVYSNKLFHFSHDKATLQSDHIGSIFETSIGKTDWEV